MIVLVTGGRDYADRERVFAELDRLHAERGPITQLIEGGATGADALAREWAEDRIGCSLTVPAEWNNLQTTEPIAIRKRKDGTFYNALAGPNRNKKMVGMNVDVCIAFPGGNGTENCVWQARKASIEVIEVAEAGNMA